MRLFGAGVALGTMAGTIVVLLVDEWLKTKWPA